MKSRSKPERPQKAFGLCFCPHPAPAAPSAGALQSLPFFFYLFGLKKVTESATVYRRNYRPFSHSIDSVELDFVLDPESTLVTNKMKVTPQRQSGESNLVLNAKNLTFESLSIDGVPAASDRYRLTDTTLTIFGVRHQTTLTIVNRFSAAKNTDLSGIYMSAGAFMSQCEAEGFRAITYWPDRPDVMSRFTVTIHADKTAYPVLLSNGNLVDSGEEDEGRHWARWEDPFKKPCYLFALVAGAFVDRSEKVTLKNGHECLLQVWTDEKNYEKSAWALTSLKKAIFWDEERFGLELDLNRFMIVATDDFNFGAMENKGLNIFNSRYVMASPLSATDDDYAAIESVVGHEYFHNWTGDRVTLRDWFQLTLKEGLTVFRDQEFSMDMAPDASSRAVKRIRDVRALRTAQFPEDAGPMSHPIRPDSYREINNFYTMTVYEKGAEVVRMLQTMLGKAGFKKGLDLYIQRHDGSAVTCDDFIRAMAAANDIDLSQFARWWAQSGTPRVTIEAPTYDEKTRTLTIRARQATPATADQKEKLPLIIPISLGLLDSRGNDMDLVLADAPEASPEKTKTLILRDEADEWVFTNIPENPVLSIGRGFSAPVIFDFPYSRGELAFLSCHDSDAFNRAEAFERLSLECLGEMIDAAERNEDIPVPDDWMETFHQILTDDSLSPQFRSVVLTMPSETTISHTRTMINPETIRRMRCAAIASLGSHLSADLSAQVLKNFTPGNYDPEARQAGKRALKNVALDYWLAGGNAKALLTARDQFDNGDNLTDQLAALKMIVNSQSPAKVDVLNAAANRWYQDPLLINKWFTVQATAIASQGEAPVLDRVKALMNSGVFSLANPNNVYALLNAFMTSNLAEFHREDGEGYLFWEEMVKKTDAINTHVSARLARALDNWRRFEPRRAKLMHQSLVKIASMKTLSPGVREIVDKALNFR